MKKTLPILLMVLSMAFAMPVTASTYASAVELIDLEQPNITLTYNNGVMHVTGASNMVVTIYNLAGIAVKSFRVDGQDKHITLPLADGIYIIKIGSSFTRKITVGRK